MIFGKLFSDHYTQGDRYMQGRYNTGSTVHVSANNHSIYVLLTKTSNNNAINVIKWPIKCL